MPKGCRRAGVLGDRGVCPSEGRTVDRNGALASFSCVSFVVDGGVESLRVDVIICV